ncbi:hypothetical protein [Methylorubrum populi]
MSTSPFESFPAIAAFNRRWVAELWAQRLDTVAIAEATALPQAEVCRILAKLQDERHAARTPKTGGGHAAR